MKPSTNYSPEVLGIGRSAYERVTFLASPGNDAKAVGWACLLLVLMPGVAWGQQLELEKVLEAQRDEDAWKKVVDCKGAESYLEERPEGLFAKEARKCLEAGQAERLLEACEVHFAAGRLSRGLGGTAVDCYKEVLSMDPGNREALSGLKRVMEEYERRARKALQDGKVERAKGYVERMAELSPESREVMELEDAIAEAERKNREAEESRRAEAEARRRAEAERKAREAEERRRAEAERKEREAEERRRRAQAPGTELRDCPECPKMVVVPSGRFMMGSRSGDDDELPVHEVAIARPFAVGVYEVTFDEWDACVSDRGCGGYRPDGEGWGRGNRPVVNVSWDDAKAYVRWLTGKTGKKYRLLSESEWEYVARGGTTTARYWGEGEMGQCRYANGADREAKRHNSGWTVADCDDGYYRTAPVGSFQANGYKLHDVLGNVWEWTEDCWNESYAGAPSDGSAWKSGDCSRRVVRGGSWDLEPRNLRSAYRGGDGSGGRFVSNGFRIARTLTP